MAKRRNIIEDEPQEVTEISKPVVKMVVAVKAISGIHGMILPGNPFTAADVAGGDESITNLIKSGAAKAV